MKALSEQSLERILPLKRQNGTVEVQCERGASDSAGDKRLGVLVFWTLFNQLGREEASSAIACSAMARVLGGEATGFSSSAFACSAVFRLCVPTASPRPSERSPSAAPL